MRNRRLFLLFLLLCITLAACSPGHLGSTEIAFVRDGHLWTSDPNGANAFEVVSDNSPVIGYGWSPDHQIFMYRQLDSRFARTEVGKHLVINPLTGLPGDLPSSLNTISLDGGMPIPIFGSTLAMQRSNAWWNTTGNRLLYREEPVHAQGLLPLAVSWWVSQDDQPDGIARKALPSSFSIPSLGSLYSMAIGNSQKGIFTTTLAGTDLHTLATGTLPGHPLPATLERVLWQPAQQHPLLLYAMITTATPQPPISHVTTPAVQLVLNNGTGMISTIATCYCTQFAWSPDGNSILYSAGATYYVYNVNTRVVFSFTGEDGSVPYWSPDSRAILLDGLHSLSLISISRQSQQKLLSDNAPETGLAEIPDANTLVQPLSNSLWAADSIHFLVLTRGRLFWQDQRLDTGNGLYTGMLENTGQAQRALTLVDKGNDSQPGWSYEDPNTSFLFS